jgi:hypothetical protein
MTEDPTPSPRGPIPLRTGGCTPVSFIIQSGQRRTRPPDGHPSQPTSNRRPAPADFTVLEERRAEQSKPTPLGATRLAGGPGTPVRFTLHLRRARCPPAGVVRADHPEATDRLGRVRLRLAAIPTQYPPWDSNPDDTRSERAGSAVGLEGLGVTDRIRTGPPSLASSDANR